MPGSRKPNEWSALSALALIGQLGLVVAVSVVGAVLAGAYLDEKLGARGLVLVAAILLGVAGGVYAVWRILAKELNWKP